MPLPAPDRRGEIHFYFAKSMPYNRRMSAAFSLMAIGLVAQVVLPIYLMAAGLVAVAAGVALLLVKGYENKVEGARPSSDWKPARRQEIQRILDINQKQKSWDNDAVDITSAGGCALLVGAVVVVAVVAGMIMPLSPKAGILIVANAAVALLPFWVTGVRRILKNDRLVVKAGMLLRIEDAFQKAKPAAGEEFVYQIQTAKSSDGAGEVPHDVKAILRFGNAPESFLGLQMQISINSVQGSDYPYFYCVLVAKKDFGNLTRKMSKPPNGVVLEPSGENEVDIVVIRQHTTRKSGFHTKQDAAENIFRYALAQARRVTAS